MSSLSDPFSWESPQSRRAALPALQACPHNKAQATSKKQKGVASVANQYKVGTFCLDALLESSQKTNWDLVLFTLAECLNDNAGLSF
jgi:hypothetical protein